MVDAVKKLGSQASEFAHEEEAHNLPQVEQQQARLAQDVLHDLRTFASSSSWYTPRTTWPLRSVRRFRHLE